MDETKREIEIYISEKKIEEALKVLEGLHIDNADIGNLKWRADVYYSLQKFTKALNDFNKVLKVEPENKIVSSKIEMIKEIIKFELLDIYGSTNLNLDPWLDD